MHSLKLLSSAAAIAMVAAAAPALAQLADVSIEGPIASFESVPVPPPPAPNTNQPIIGTLKVMGATVAVLGNTVIHSPTNDDLTWEQFTTKAFVGRTEPGFLGGTAIVTGDSANGVIYAADLFSDMAENVVVGEATAAVDDGPTKRATVNNIPLVPLDDVRMPAGRPINGFGFKIKPAEITAGTLVAVEGYYAAGKLNYHTLEADGAVLDSPGTSEVSILRAQCRFRGGARNELELRGGAKQPANGQVTVQYSYNGGTTWTTAGTAAPVADNTVVPAQGLYRYSTSALRFPAGATVCPGQVRAIFTASLRTNNFAGAATATPDSR